MRYRDFTPTMRRWLAGREAFRRLGFSADDLYCEVARSARHGGVLSAFVLLRAQEKEFRLEVGPVKSEEAFADEYRKACDALNSGQVPLKDQNRIWREGEACQRAADFVRAIESKGIVIPGPPSASLN